VLDLYRAAGRRGGDERASWQERLDALSPDLRAEWDAGLTGSPVPGRDLALPSWEPGASVATRKASEACLRALAEVVPSLVAGGADLTGNTGTTFDAHGVQSPTEPGGRQIYFGIREHAMAAAMNGMALHGGI